ncbi:PGF-CTERM sorting domain-containing protein [Methanofollis ethanolicus]|uniref:PGF-CTERM sorting domain-containing protein n=1 Tax=Methanofollis ethanolicus TaxID=488124 RepID=UPI00128FC549|nr:PGF-CTERM sorting domain-containing protein [Methanofollis ethanolicus]
MNFSAYSDPIKGEPVRIVRIDESGQQVDPIAITDNVANYIRGKSGQYYPVYSDGNRSGSKYCLIQNAADILGQMKIRTVGTDIEPDTNPSQQNTIPYRMSIQFQMPDQNLPLSQFRDSWYEYELQGNVKTSSITNTAGNTVSLKGLSVNPATPDNTYVFRLSDQRAISSGSDATMVFRLTLNDMNYELPYSFRVQDYPLALKLSESSVQRSDDLILTVQGTPFMQYDVTLPVPGPGEDYPLFEGGGWDDPKISDYHVRVHPGWDGTVRLNIHIPKNAPTTSYTASATGPGIVQPVTTTFYVDTKTMNLIFDEPDENQYALGDTIELSGKLTNIDKTSATTLIPIYLSVTGPNLPPNGAPLTNPSQEVVDSAPDTFTVTSYNPVLGLWSYSWDTSKFAGDEGTYTAHANLQPIGYLKSSYPGSPGSIDGEVPPSWEYELSAPTIHAKFDEKTGGVFARGDYLYSWWYGRGSPGKTSTLSSTGHMKWYIFGPNFRYADYNSRFPLGDEGSYGITHSRNFTYDLTPGEYFIVYHHPGHNNQFDLLPENNLYFRGILNQMFNADGTLKANLGSLDARNAADALVKALDSPTIDDTYVMDTFTVEDPLIRIRSPGDLVVGDKLVVEGATNLAGKGTTADGTDIADKLTLTITALNLYEGGKANTVMNITTDNTYPEKYDPATGIRPFSYDPIDTASWYPGLYQITVLCKDVRYKSTSTFELLGEGSQRTTTANDAQNPFPPRTTATPAPASSVEPTFTPTSLPATQSPGFEALIAVAAVLGVLITRRRR